MRHRVGSRVRDSRAAGIRLGTITKIEDGIGTIRWDDGRSEYPGADDTFDAGLTDEEAYFKTLRKRRRKRRRPRRAP